MDSSVPPAAVTRTAVRWQTSWRGLAETPWGLRVLHEALVAGRAGRDPRRIDETGATMQNAESQVERIKDDWIRETVVPKPSRNRVRPPAPRRRSAREKYEDAVLDLHNAVYAVTRALTMVENFTDTNRKNLALEYGIRPSSRADGMIAELQKAQTAIVRLQTYGTSYSERFIADPDTDEDEPVEPAEVE